MTPFSRAKAVLESIGYTVGKTENWNPFARIRQDLYGCIDMVCMRHGDPLLAVQVTSKTNVSARLKKSHAVALQWVSTGNRFEVWGVGSKKKDQTRIVRMGMDGEWIEKE